MLGFGWTDHNIGWFWNITAKSTNCSMSQIKTFSFFKIHCGGQGYLSEWQSKDLDMETGRRDYRPSHLTKSHLLWYLPQMPLLEFSSYDYWEISACEKTGGKHDTYLDVYSDRNQAKLLHVSHTIHNSQQASLFL